MQSRDKADKQYRILVADDNRDSAESLKTLLELTGHRVTVAYDGHRALEIARQTRPHVVFLDIVLPGIDGYTLARMLRQELGHQDVRIFAVSGFNQEDGQRSLEAGFDQYFVKPMDPEFIASLLSRAKRNN
jgi:CheY-like chemotaxis protein